MTSQKFNRYVNKEKFHREVEVPDGACRVIKLPPEDACGSHEFDDGYLRSLNSITSTDGFRIRGYKVA